IFSQGFIFILLLTSDLFGQTGFFRQEIENIITTKKASVGVSVLGIEDGDTLSINGDKNYPLMSAFKFPIALYALHKVDEGALDLDREIPIEASDLTPDTWSPIRD